MYCDDFRLDAVDEDCVAVYVDLNYDDVFVLWLIVVCECVGWLVFDSFVMGCCVVCAWCCYDLCGFVNGASPVRNLQHGVCLGISM